MPKPFYEVVEEALGADVFRGKQVADIGCFRFAESVVLRDRGADVTAVDRTEYEPAPEGITFEKSDVLGWHPRRAMDILYLSNIALFVPTKELFDHLGLLRPRVIAVRTMSAAPEPNWDAAKTRTLYFTTPEEWVERFAAAGYIARHTAQYSEETPDLHGVMRRFHFTEYIGEHTG